MQSREALLKEYRQKAKLADARLRNIEAKSRRPEYKGIKEYAYKTAVKDIKSFGGNKRFNTKPPENNRKLMAKISAIDKFLESPSSLIDKVVKLPSGETQRIGIKSMYKARADKLNKNWGTNFTWRTLAKYFERGYDKALESLLGNSGRALQAVATIQKNKRKIKKAIKDNEDIDIEIEDEFLEKELENILSSDLGKDLAKDLL